MIELIVFLGVLALVILTLARTIRVVPQARAGVVERFGRYSRTLNAGLTIVVGRWLEKRNETKAHAAVDLLHQKKD